MFPHLWWGNRLFPRLTRGFRAREVVLNCKSSGWMNGLRKGGKDLGVVSCCIQSLQALGVGFAFRNHPCFARQRWPERQEELSWSSSITSLPFRRLKCVWLGPLRSAKEQKQTKVPNVQAELAAQERKGLHLSKKDGNTNEHNTNNNILYRRPKGYRRHLLNQTHPNREP